jgi:hypothetical protein
MDVAVYFGPEQLESILANRKKDLGIAFESGRRLGHELAFTPASTSAEAGASEFDPSYFPPSERHSTAMRKMLLRACNGRSCLISDAVRNSEHEAPRPCANQTVSSA